MRVTPQRSLKPTIALSAGSQHFTQWDLFVYQKDWLSLLEILLMVLWKTILFERTGGGRKPANTNPVPDSI